MFIHYVCELQKPKKMKINSILIAIALILVCSINDINGQVYKTLNVIKAGDLISNLTEAESNEITHLTITGKINAIDFKHLRDGFKSLESLDISNADIRMYTGKEGTYPNKLYVYPKNCIPAYAFCKTIDGQEIGKPSLKKVKLSEKIWNIEDAAFKNCKNLQVLEIGKKKAPNLLTDALLNTNTTIFVPLGSGDNYRMNEKWKSFSILEGTPLKVDVKIATESNLSDELLNIGVQPNDVNFLSIEGKLDETDFKVIRNYMSSLVSLDIKKTSARRIPEFTFSKKIYLSSIELPSQLEVIEQRAFSNCERLSGNVILPKTMTALEYGAFLDCKRLKKVIVTGNNLNTIASDVFGEDSSTQLEYLK